MTVSLTLYLWGAESNEDHFQPTKRGGVNQERSAPPAVAILFFQFFPSLSVFPLYADVYMHLYRCIRVGHGIVGK